MNKHRGLWIARYLAGGLLLAGTVRLAAQVSTLTVGGGELDLGGGSLTAGGFTLGETAVLRGNGTINAPATLHGRVAPGVAGAVGMLTFGDSVLLIRAVYECDVASHADLDRIIAAGDVSGMATVEINAHPDAIPLWRIIIEGGAGSDYDAITAVLPADWRLEAMGSRNLTLTSLTGDTDGDGLPDWWEVLYFGDPEAAVPDRSVADPEGDADHDMFKNLHEYLAGTDPTDPQSLLRLVRAGPSALDPNETEVTWQSVPGKTYTVQGRASFEAGSDWAELAAGVPAHASDAVTVWTHTGAPMPYYYRVRLD